MESVRGGVHLECNEATACDIEVDTKRRCFCRHEADFALQAHVECRAFEPERVDRSRFCCEDSAVALKCAVVSR